MLILHHSALFSSTPPPVLLLPAPPEFAARTRRLALPAPKIAGLLPASTMNTAGKDIELPLHGHDSISANVSIAPIKRVVEAEIANPARLLDDRERGMWWEDIQRLLGPQKTQAEREADVLAYVFGTPAYRAQKDAEKRAQREAMARFMAEWGLA